MLKSRAVSNIISQKLVSERFLSLKPTEKHITVVDSAGVPFFGSLHHIPTSLGGLLVHLDFLVVKEAPSGLIIRIPNLEELKACTDPSKQHVQMTIVDSTMRLGLDLDMKQVANNAFST